MGKGVHSKVHKRKQAVKIRYVEQNIAPARYQKIHENILHTIRGTEQKKEEKVNAFLYPSHPKAEFPQYQLPDMTDLRSTNIQFAGKEYRGAYRKRNTAVIKEKEQLEKQQLITIEQEYDSDDDNNKQEEENENEDELISGLEKIKIGKKKGKKAEVMMEEKSKAINKQKFRKGGCKRSKNIMTVFTRYSGNKRRK